MTSHRGLVYDLAIRDEDGNVIETDRAFNLVPDEGLRHMLGVTLKGVAPIANWYIMLFEGNYTPLGSVTAATLPSVSTECTTYSPSTRVAFISGAISGNAVDNSASQAVFTMTANKTIYGCALVSAQAKGATTGVALSVVRFTAPKVLTTGKTLTVYAGPTALPFTE